MQRLCLPPGVTTPRPCLDGLGALIHARPLSACSAAEPRPDRSGPRRGPPASVPPTKSGAGEGALIKSRASSTRTIARDGAEGHGPLERRRVAVRIQPAFCGSNGDIVARRVTEKPGRELRAEDVLEAEHARALDVLGVVEHRRRRSDLPDRAGVEDQDAVGHGRGFVRVVGHQERGRAGGREDVPEVGDESARLGGSSEPNGSSSSSSSGASASARARLTRCASPPDRAVAARLATRSSPSRSIPFRYAPAAHRTGDALEAEPGLDIRARGAASQQRPLQDGRTDAADLPRRGSRGVRAGAPARGRDCEGRRQCAAASTCRPRWRRGSRASPPAMLSRSTPGSCDRRERRRCLRAPAARSRSMLLHRREDEVHGEGEREQDDAERERAGERALRRLEHRGGGQRRASDRRCFRRPSAPRRPPR